VTEALPCYISGEKVRCGDAISYNGQAGTIVFVIERGEYTPDFPAADWSHCGRGFMVRFQNSALLMLEDADEDLVLIHRAS
jgi:hypothetical protein